jgi:hypothetical protein
LLGTRLQRWLLLADWPIRDVDRALRIFRMYSQRWAMEDSLPFVEYAVGGEEVPLLDLHGIRTLLALAWIAAGVLYGLGVTWDWEEVESLARIGGWVQRKDNKPGKIVITRGLCRLLDKLIAEAFLHQHLANTATHRRASLPSCDHPPHRGHDRISNIALDRTRNT